MESSLQSNTVLACIKELEASISTKLAHLANAQVTSPVFLYQVKC